MFLRPRIVRLAGGAALWLGLFPATAVSAQEVIGNIIGHVRISPSGTTAGNVLVSLELRGGALDSVYTDSQGTFGFHGLVPNPYYVVVNDEHYEAVRREVDIDSSMMSPVTIIEITLVPKKSADASSADAKSQGANPAMTDIREYSAHFPKPAVKEFEKGLKADQAGKKKEAIQHYEKAVEAAPDFYPAHNNLGSDYLSEGNFEGAHKEFEKVIQLNNSDAAAYFNLANVCMQTGDLAGAEYYLTEAKRRQPESALGHFLGGSLDMRLNRPADAERHLRQAIELSPTMAQPRLQLVKLFIQQGRKDDAMAQLHDFLTAFPDSAFAPPARQLLKRLESESSASVHPN